MLWLISGCALGALGALLQRWQLPSAVWVSISGAAVLFLGFFRWLNSSGPRSSHCGSSSGDSCLSTGSDFSTDSLGSNDGDGGCGGD